MPILKHAIKKMRQDKKRTIANKAKKTALRTTLKKARTSMNAESLSAAFSRLDKAAKTHLIHKNKASRLKSRLAKAIAKIAAPAAAAPKKAAKAKTTKVAAEKPAVAKKPRTTKKTAEAKA